MSEAPNPAPAAAAAPSAPEPAVAALPAGSPLGENPPTGTEPAEAPEPTLDNLFKPAETPAETPAPVELTPEVLAERVTALDLTLPEDMQVNEEALGSFKTFCAKQGLGKEQAQSVLDMHTSEIKAIASQAAQQFADTVATWKDEIKSDPTIGGPKLPQTLRTVAKAIDQFGGQDLRAAFDATGAGWNPSILRFIHAMASKLVEPTPVVPPRPGPVPNANRPGYEILYPDSQGT